MIAYKCDRCGALLAADMSGLSRTGTAIKESAMDDFEETKACLSRYRKLRRKVRSLILDLIELKEAAESAGSIPGDGLPHAHTPHGLEDKVGRVLELEKKLQAAKEASLAEREKIEDLLLQVQDPDEQAVLRCRYISQMNWYDIAEQLYLSKSTVQRIHARGIRSVMKLAHFDTQHSDNMVGVK